MSSYDDSYGAKSATRILRSGLSAYHPKPHIDERERATANYQEFMQLREAEKLKK